MGGVEAALMYRPRGCFDISSWKSGGNIRSGPGGNQAGNQVGIAGDQGARKTGEKERDR